MTPADTALPPGVTPETVVTVCAECNRASCWQYVFLCERAAAADVKEMRVAELVPLHLENPEYWDIDPAWGVARVTVARTRPSGDSRTALR